MKPIFLIIASALFAVVSCNPIVIYGTGLNNDQSLAVNGTVDLHWYLLGNGQNQSPPATREVPMNPTVYVANVIPMNWAPATAHSKWVGPAKNLAGTFTANKVYTYYQNFSLYGVDPNTASLNLAVAAAETFQVKLNGNTIGSCIAGCSASFTNYVVNTGFVPGVNQLTIMVADISGGPTGLQVAVTGTASPRSPRDMCAAGSILDFGLYGRGYYCLDDHTFVECWGFGVNLQFAVNLCPTGTRCRCQPGSECSNGNTVSPCGPFLI